MNDYAVELQHISMQYPNTDFLANDNVSLSVEKGTVMSLIGENGAGKSTLMNILYGLFKPTWGTIKIYGKEHIFHSSLDALHANIGMVHQHFMLVDELSVLENIILGNEPKKNTSIDYKQAAVTIENLMRENNMQIPLHTKIEHLPLGQQQKVEIIKILFRGADILIFDEPTAVLTPQETDELFVNMRNLIAQGKTIIFITHKLDEVIQVSDIIACMRQGKLVGITTKAKATKESLAEMMVGCKIPALRERQDTGRQEIVASITDVHLCRKDEKPLLDTINAEIHKGEIVGVAGISGNGQVPFAEILAGTRQVSAGTIEISGKAITGVPRKKRMAQGISYIPFDRKKEGLNISWSIAQNAFAGYHTMNTFTRKIGNIHFINNKAVMQNAYAIIDHFGVKAPGPNTLIDSLSGGNQQKVVIGRETAVRKPELLIAAEPTRGVDIGAISFIYDYLLQLRNEGTGILLFSSDLDEIFALSDTIWVMYEGKIVCKTKPQNITKEELGLYMAGSKAMEEFT